MQLLNLVTWVSIGLIVHVYVGYPLLVALLSRLRRRPVARAEVTPRVSLIIAAYNEEEVIGRKIENSLELDYPREALEIIVINDGSNDATPTIAAGYAGAGVLVLHDKPRLGKSAALNRAATHATGDILVFSDANAFYHRDALRKLVRNFADPEVGCASGRKTVVRGEAARGASEGAYWRYESAIKEHESLLGSTVGVSGEMLAIRRPLFRPIPQRIINDDFYLALSVLLAGHRVLYEPEAISWELGAASVGEDAVRRRRIAAGRYQVMLSPRTFWPWRRPWVLFQMISHKFLRLALPFLMLAALIGSAALVLARVAHPSLASLLVLQLSFYILASAGWMTERQGKHSGVPALAYYVTRSNVAALQSLSAYLSGRQTVLWTKAQRQKLT